MGRSKLDIGWTARRRREKECQSSKRRACILSLGVVCMPRTTGWDLNRNVSCVRSSLLAEFILVGEEMNIALATKAVGFCRLYCKKKKKKEYRIIMLV